MSTQSDLISTVTDALKRMEESNAAKLEESLDQVRAQFAFEDKHWQLLGAYASGDKLEGLDLDEVKTISEKARPRAAIASLDKRALDLHTGYVFANGLTFEGTKRAENAKGTPPDKVKFFENPINQAELFSEEAHALLQSTRFTDGNVLALCDTKERTVRIIPLSQIDSVMVSEEFPGEVWAYRRTWRPKGADKPRAEWIYTNRYTGAVPTSYGEKDEKTPVRKDARMVDLRANRQSGWALGIPDAAAGMLWAESYSQVLQYGQIVNESLASVIYKVTSKTAKGAKTAGVKMSGADGFGNAATMGEGQDLQMVNSSMRSFDFSAARPLSAMAATAWNVSNIDLLSDSSAAGSSYGSAQALTAGILNAMLSMQKQWTRFYKDIFQAMGLGRVGVHWEPLETADPYRKAQEITLLSPALSDEEYRSAVLEQLDIVGKADEIPPSLLARHTTPETPTVQASPDQGQNSPAGGADSGSLNDQRSDGIGESLLTAMQMETFIERLDEISNRMSDIENKP